MLSYFFSAGHFDNARYISWHFLEMHNLPHNVKADFIALVHVCWHYESVLNSVSSDQFREPTAIKISKGGMKGITLLPELTTEWVDSFPISAYLSDDMKNMYLSTVSTAITLAKQKEEDVKRKALDAKDRARIRTL
jgi:hypothetical protein